MTTQTDTKTHTVVYARHVASKVAADLKRLQRLFGKNQPTDDSIDKFEREATILLYHGCLGEISYGFIKEDGSWLYALKYQNVNNQLREDDGPKEIGSQDIDETNFRSFLIYSDHWQDLSEEQRNQIEQSLPIQDYRQSRPMETIGSPTANNVSGNIGVQRFIAN